MAVFCFPQQGWLLAEMVQAMFEAKHEHVYLKLWPITSSVFKMTKIKPGGSVARL